MVEYLERKVLFHHSAINLGKTLNCQLNRQGWVLKSK